MSIPVPTRRRPRGDAATTAARKAAAGEPRVDDSPVARFAESLRRTTFQARDAIKRADRDPRVWRDLRREIESLEREIDRLGLPGLHPFLQALGRRVEAALENDREP